MSLEIELHMGSGANEQVDMQSLKYINCEEDCDDHVAIGYYIKDSQLGSNTQVRVEV